MSNSLRQWQSSVAISPKWSWALSHLQFATVALGWRPQSFDRKADKKLSYRYKQGVSYVAQLGEGEVVWVGRDWILSGCLL